ncbi:MAG: class I SAM-dependent methyltransferase [Bacteroidota bacterium]
MKKDLSNGYQRIAETFIAARGVHSAGVGTDQIRVWAQMLAKEAKVLDVGCGTGIPLTAVLMQEGLQVFAIDASATLIDAFKANFPTAQVACAAAEESDFFGKKFNGILSWGMIFLLSEENQLVVLEKMAKALLPGGKLLFTAPKQQVEWMDVLTGELSRSLGKETYVQLLSQFGLQLTETFEDDGGNHYFSFNVR